MVPTSPTNCSKRCVSPARGWTNHTVATSPTSISALEKAHIRPKVGVGIFLDPYDAVSTPFDDDKYKRMHVMEGW